MTAPRPKVYTARVLVSLTPDELQAWRQRADEELKTLSEWVRSQCARPAVIVKRAFVDDHGIQHGEVTIEDSRADGVREHGESGMAQRSIGAPVRTAAGTRAAKVCPHGKAKGFHCWQCKGKAKV